MSVKVEWGQMPEGSSIQCSVAGCDETATQYRADCDEEGREYWRSCYCVKHAVREGFHHPEE